MKKSFKQDFLDAWDRIESNKPFAHSRYADGEICLMRGSPIGPGSQATDVDRWTAPDKMTKLGEDLKIALNHTDEEYYYAISCDTSSTLDKQFLLDNIQQDRKFITFANLWINGNYDDFFEKINSLDKSVIIFGNKNGETAKYPFEVEQYLSFGDNCVDTWEQFHQDIKDLLTNSFSECEGKTFLISVGPMSEVLIDHLWKINPKNQYIDMGSALDEFVHGRKTRHYMISESFYNKQICEMEV